jgi:hypothetical protein|tara:strand:+ start:2187 stop:2777 length:591 start_codon:yes stop_codon:yes gene_type:complete
MMPFDCYKTYIAMKSHFTKNSYDYLRYGNRLPRLTVNSFYQRKDRFFFEKMSRQFDGNEIEKFFIANFTAGTDPEKVFISDIIKTGRDTYIEWQKRNQSLSYTFKEDLNKLFDGRNLDEVFSCKKGHPLILKNYLGGHICLETLVICNKILGYTQNFDKKLDPYVWSTVSMKIKKYEPFINIDVFHYKKILKQIAL